MHLELLNAVEFEVIHGKSMPIISSAMMSRQHQNVKDSLPKLAAVQFFTEVLDKIAFENEKDIHLWEFLNTMLVDFDALPSDDVLPLFRKHQAEFLKVLGYAFPTKKHSELNTFFEYIVGRKISSLNFLYQVIK